MKRIKYWLFFAMVLLLVSCNNHKKQEQVKEEAPSSIKLNSNYWRFAVPITLKFLQ